MQEAQGGQKELSAQVLFPPWLWALALGESLLLEFGVIAQVHKGDLPLFPHYRVCWNFSSPGRRESRTWQGGNLGN